MKRMPGMLIRIGLILLIFGFFKDTTVDSSLGQIHNIGLMQQSQNLMILGGFLFLGGLILHASSKKAVSTESDEDSEEIGRKLTEAGGLIQEKMASGTATLQSIVIRANAYRDRYFLRLGIGLLSGLLVSIFFVFYLPAVFVCCLLFVGLAMRKLPAVVALRKALLVATIPAGLLTIVGTISNIDSPHPSLIVSAVMSLPFIILLTVYLHFRKVSKQQLLIP